jgi:AcrR family transcriptional regulator
MVFDMAERAGAIRSGAKFSARISTQVDSSADSQNVKGDEVRQQIIDAAALAFMKRGYAATSIDTVAEHIGATKGLVYYYFKSKGDLYLTIHLRAMELSLSAVRPIAIGPCTPSERLGKMIYTHTQLLMNNFAMHKVSLEGVTAHLRGSTTPEQRRTLSTLIKMRDEYEQFYVEVLKEGAKTGEFREIDTSLTVKLLLGTVNWMTIWFRPARSRGKKANDRIAAEAVEFVVSAVCNRQHKRSR